MANYRQLLILGQSTKVNCFGWLDIHNKCHKKSYIKVGPNQIKSMPELSYDWSIALTFVSMALTILGILFLFIKLFCTAYSNEDTNEVNQNHFWSFLKKAFKCLHI